MPANAIAANRQVALDFLAAIVSGDIARLDALLHPDCTWWVQGWGTMPRDRFLASLASTIARAPTRRMEIVLVTAEEDRVAVVAEGSFAFPEGTYANSYHYLFRIEAGRISTGREYLDTRIAAAFFAAASADGQLRADADTLVR